jgi:serine/threonine protein kinase
MGQAKIIHNESFLTKVSDALGSFLKVFTGDDNFVLGKLKQADIIVDGKHYQALGKMLVSGKISECYRLTLEDDAENDTELVLRRLVDNFTRQHPNCADMLKREFEIHKELKLAECKSLIDIYDYIPEEKSVISKLIPGISLRQFVEQQPEYLFKRRTTIKFLKELIKTINFLHKKGLCHFDITPDNILLKLTPDHDMVLLNIGLAAAYYDKVDIGPFVDTTLPPEMQKGRFCDQKTDIYEIGQIIKFIINVRKKDPTRASNHLKMIAMKCTRKDHEERYDNVMEIYRDIEVWEHKYDNFFDGV